MNLTALRRFGGDTLAADEYLFGGNAYPLFPHQVEYYRLADLHKYMWVEWARGAGKTWTAARRAAVRMVMEPDRAFVFAGPTGRQAEHLFRYLLDLLRRSPRTRPLIARVLDNPEEREVTLTNGSTAVALPASGDFSRGERATDIIVTEFFAYPERAYRADLSPMAAVKRGDRDNRITVETSAGWQGSPQWKERERWRAQVAKRHPHYGFLAIDADDLRAEAYPMDWDILAAAREADTDSYLQQYMNVWPSLVGNFYEFAVLANPELQTAEILRSARPGKTYVAGGDVARVKGGDDSAFAVLELDPSAPPALVFLWSGNGMTAEAIADEWAPLIDRYGVGTLVLDTRGGGINVLDVLRAKHGICASGEDRGRPVVQPFTSSPADLNVMHQTFRAACEQKTIAFPQEPDRSDAQLLRAYRLVDEAVGQFCNLKTERSPSTGLLRFDIPHGKKRDLCYGILYAWWAWRQLQQTPPAPPAWPRGSPIIDSELGEVFGPWGDPRRGWTR